MNIKNKEERQILLVISPFLEFEVKNPHFGATKLIYYLIEKFSVKYCVQYLSLTKIRGLFVPYLLKIHLIFRYYHHYIPEKTKKKSICSRLFSIIFKNEKLRWSLNLLYYVVLELFSFIDIVYKKNINRKILMIFGRKRGIVLHNFPFLVKIINRKVLNRNKISLYLLEHSVEYIFFEEKIIYLFKPLLLFLKKLEIQACRYVNKTICVSFYDKIVLENNGIKNCDIINIITITTPQQSTKKDNTQNVNENLKKKFVIGFVGAKFFANIVAVYNIIRLAKQLPKDVVFLIIGSVCEVFKDKKLPENVILLGYVKNLYDYLSLCNAFINPKTVSDTGIEVKMFDYLQFDKPIICTEVGARGFENNKNVLIGKTLTDLKNIILQLYNEWKTNK